MEESYKTELAINLRELNRLVFWHQLIVLRRILSTKKFFREYSSISMTLVFEPKTIKHGVSDVASKS